LKGRVDGEVGRWLDLTRHGTALVHLGIHLGKEKGWPWLETRHDDDESGCDAARRSRPEVHGGVVLRWLAKEQVDEV
jgi:hypothetical protein